MKYRNLASAMCACFVVGLAVLLLAGQAFATPANLAAYRTAVLADGPSGYWPLDEEGHPQTANDASGVGGTNNGTYYSGAGTRTPAPFLQGTGFMNPTANAYNSNNQFDHIRIPDTFANGAMAATEFTIEHWIQPDQGAPPTQGNIFVRGFFFNDAVTAVESAFTQQFGPPVVGGLNANGTVSSQANIIQGEWTHVALTVKPDGIGGSDLTLYHNGLAVASANDPNLQADSTGDDITIGTLPVGAPPNVYSALVQGFDGAIDEIAYYDYALTAQQVSNHFNATDAIPEPSSLALLSLSGLAGFLGVRRRRR